MKLKLTDAAIDKLTLSDGKSETFFWDSDIPGFGLRWRAGGDRTWVLQFRIGARGRRMTLGKCSALSAPAARATAVKLYARTKLGEDPAATKKAKAATALGETFLDAADIYLRRRAESLRARSLIGIRHHLLTLARPLHKMSLTEIDRRTISKLLSALADSSGPVTANRVGSSIAAMLAWCIREGWIDHNAASTLNKRPETPRSRVLSDSELRQIWAATSGTDQHSAIVRLLLLTGCRREEIGGLAWSEIDFDAATVVLPPERTKSRREHLVPLSQMAIDILNSVERRDRVHVFGEDRISPGGWRGWSRGKSELDARAKIAPGWVLHDLRRTVSTRMNGELGIAPHIVESVLAHVGHKSGVAGVYNKAAYTNEKRQALDMWSERVASIVEDRPAKVVSLLRA